MSKTVYYFESGNTEKSIEVNDDGTVTYHTENAGWVAWRKGPEGKDQKMTAEKAKERWPQHAEAIDKALKELAAERAKSSN